MKSIGVIIALLVVIIMILIIGIGFALMSNNETEQVAPVNNTAVEENVSDEVITATMESKEYDDSPKQYDDWQEDYETGEYDEDGNPIYRSVVSTSGGQSEPGIYEAYWSANGPISEERIG